MSSDSEEDYDDNQDSSSDDERQCKKRKLSDHELLKDFHKLCDDEIYRLFQFLTIGDLIGSVQLVCHKFHSMITSEQQESISLLIAIGNHFVNSIVNDSEGEGFGSAFFSHHLHDDEFIPNSTIRNTSKIHTSKLLYSEEKVKLMKERRQQAIRACVNKGCEGDFTIGLWDQLRYRWFMLKREPFASREALLVTAYFEGDEDCALTPLEGELSEQLEEISHSTHADSIYFGCDQDEEEQEDEQDDEQDEIEEKSSLVPYSTWIRSNSEKIKHVKSVYWMYSSPDHQLRDIKDGDVSAILSSMPLLNFWKSKGVHEVPFSPTLKHYHLRSLVLVSVGLGDGLLESLFKTYLPKLMHLELFLGCDEQGMDFSPEFLCQNLLSKNENGLFPSLDYLGLRNYEEVDEIIQPLFESAIGRRVRIIDLSLGMFSNCGATTVLEMWKKEELPLLEVLSLQFCYISKKNRALLLQLPISIDTEPAVNEDCNTKHDEHNIYVMDCDM